MKQFADLTQEEREDFEQALDLAIDLAAAPVSKAERPVSVPDLYRYARSTTHGRNGLVRKAILGDARINRQWASIMARMSGAQFEMAAAAAGVQDRIILQDERSGRRIELTRSDSDPDIAILMVDVGTSPATAPGACPSGRRQRPSRWICPSRIWASASLTSAMRGNSPACSGSTM